jgi:hypothetical protein
MDATPSPMAALANPPVGVVSKSPLLSNPTMLTNFSRMKLNCLIIQGRLGYMPFSIICNYQYTNGMMEVKYCWQKTFNQAISKHNLLQFLTCTNYQIEKSSIHSHLKAGVKPLLFNVGKKKPIRHSEGKGSWLHRQVR